MSERQNDGGELWEPIVTRRWWARDPAVVVQVFHGTKHQHLDWNPALSMQENMFLAACSASAAWGLNAGEEYRLQGILMGPETIGWVWVKR